MALFQPREILRTLGAHGVKYVIIGNLGGTLYGSPLTTTDADICPSRDQENLEALAAALASMGARIRTPDAPDGVPFACHATFLRQMKMVNLTTRIKQRDRTSLTAVFLRNRIWAPPPELTDVESKETR